MPIWIASYWITSYWTTNYWITSYWITSYRIMHKSLNQKSLNHKLLSVIGLNWVLEISIYTSKNSLSLISSADLNHKLYWITSYIESQVILNHAQVIESQVVECYLSRLGLRKFVYGTSKNSLSQLISMSNSTPILFLIYNLNSHLLGDGNTINTLKREAD